MWRQWRRHPLGIAGSLIILSMALLSIFAYLIIPDKSPYANEMHIQLASLPMGESVLFIEWESKVEKTPFYKGFFSGYEGLPERVPIDSFRVLEDNSITFREYGQLHWQQKEKEAYKISTHTYWFGSDRYGRDFLSRLILGARVSFIIGFIAVGISLLVGLPLGLSAGYFGGKTDRFVMWLVNVLWSVPGLLLVIAFTLAFGKGLFQVFLAIGLTMWVEVARIVRGQVKSLREREYVQLTQAMGFPHTKIIFGQIFPGVFHPLIVVSAANFAAAILLESGLSFLGYGAQPPLPTWGGMVKDHWPYLLMGKAHLVLLPGAGILLLVLAFMWIGNVLRDITDPKSL